MKIFLSVIFMIFCMASYGNENTNINYQLLYHQNSDAKSISGSIDDLLEAIRNGKQIRLYMKLGSVEHAMDAGFISVYEGHVYAQINTIQGQRPNRKTKEIELRPYAKHVGLYSTKSPYEIKWFAY